MSFEAHIEYKKREFCKDVECLYKLGLIVKKRAPPNTNALGRLVAAIATTPLGSFTIG
jgi:hypothetical protein